MKENEEFLVIGKDHPGVEVEDKATGEYQHIGDMLLPNMLHGKILHRHKKPTSWLSTLCRYKGKNPSVIDITIYGCRYSSISSVDTTRRL